MNVHELSDQYVADFAALDPMTGSYLGVPGHDHDLTDFSPEGHRARAELRERALRAVGSCEPTDDSQDLARAVFLERVGLELELHHAGLDAAALNTVSGPVQETRLTFDLMAKDTAEHWAAIAHRLAKVPQTMAGITASLRQSLDLGKAPSPRQATNVAEQCDEWSGRTGGGSFFTGLVAEADGVEGVSPALRSELAAGAGLATEAYAEFATFLREELAPKAPDRDAVGAEVYTLWSRQFLGAKLDLREAYDWGWAEFFRLEAELKQVAGRIKPGSTITEAATVLDADPRHEIRDRDQFQAWMQDLSDRALSELRGTHFDIPDELMRFECRMAPPGGAVGCYYAAPTDDFSRPGSTWWIFPADHPSFSTWRYKIDVYHEGVPGHHLQLGTAVYQADKLNRYQRLLAFAYGHGEGWALYGERLMRELGHFDEDATLFGWLNSQMFRAARVFLDIGLHLELPIPTGAGFHDGERWTPELGLEFLLNRTTVETTESHDEIERYLGWPGQATTYKLGERLWLDAITDARRRHGPSFDLRQFHMRALEMGSMGLDTLRERLMKL